MKYCFVILAILTGGLGRIVLPHEMGNSPPSEQSLVKDPHVLVETTFENISLEHFDISYRKLVIMSKNKRKAYGHFRKKYREIV